MHAGLFSPDVGNTSRASFIHRSLGQNIAKYSISVCMYTYIYTYTYMCVMWGMSTNILLYRINIHAPQYTAVEGRKTNIVWFSAECLTLSDTSWIWSTSNHRTSRTAQTSEKTCAVYVNVTCEWSGRLYILKRLGTSLLSCKPMLSLQHTRQNSGEPGSLWQRSSTLDQLWRLWILRLQLSGNGLLQYSKLNTFHLL